MASMNLTLTIQDLPLIMDVLRAAVAVCETRNNGADCYEAKDEVDALQEALLRLGAQVEHPYKVLRPESPN